MVMVFAAVALAGWTMLRAGRARTLWAVAAALVVVYGVAFTATRVRLTSFDTELRFRGDAHASLEAHPAPTRASWPGAAAGRSRCPTTSSSPTSRWILDAGERDVLARSDDSTRSRVRRGVAIYVADRAALLRQALVEEGDDPLDSVPLPGFERVATTEHYGAYVRC